MARQDTYTPVTPVDADSVVGIDASDTTQNAAGSTKRMLLSSVATYVLGKLSGADMVSAIDTELGGSTWQGGGGGTVDVVSNVAENTILGRTTSGSGDSEELTAADVRALLGVLTATVLASNSENEGASLIGIADAGAFTSETEVEGALQEIYGILDNHGDIVTQDIANFVRKHEREVIVFNAGGSSSAARPAQASDKTVIWFNHGSSLPVNMLPFDIATGQGFGVATVTTETGTSKTLAVGDEGSNIDMDNASANTLTIPANSAQAFPVGSVVAVTQLGAGTTTITASSGVDLNGSTAGSVSINNQYGGAVLRKVATDAWIAQGDIS